MKIDIWNLFQKKTKDLLFFDILITTGYNIKFVLFVKQRREIRIYIIFSFLCKNVSLKEYMFNV